MTGNKIAFDFAAKEYDTDFTFSLIGTAQRNIIHSYIEKNLRNEKVFQVLELNCGTGEDALFFAKKGFNVLATDVSEEMLKTAEEKINAAGLNSKVRIKELDINDLPEKNFGEKFDLIFSNFGGINCIGRNKLNELSRSLPGILNPSGRIIFVIMPSFCLWETFYFLIRGKFREAFRRLNKSGIDAKIKNGAIRTYYYSPGEIKKIFSEQFKVIAVKPVGLFIPPSYLENFFKRKAELFRNLKRFERSINNISAFSPLSDHYLIDLEARR